LRRTLLLAASVVLLIGPAWSQTTGETARLNVKEVFRVGDESRRDAVLFGSIVGMATNSKGQIFVVDMQVKSLMVLSDTGMLLGNTGSQGDGPGEFSLAYDVKFFADTVSVWGSKAKRISVFEPRAHRFVGSMSVLDAESSGKYPSQMLGVTPHAFLLKYAAPFTFLGTSDEFAKDDHYDVVRLVNRNGAVVGPRSPDCRCWKFSPLKGT